MRPVQYGNAGQKRKGLDEEADKRKMLRRYDHLAVQALNPFGVSEINKATLGQLWEIISNGNKTTSYFAEWPDKDPYRKGIAISRLAQVLEACVEVLKDAKFSQLLEKGILKNALQEAGELSKYLSTLNGGKSSQGPKKISLSTLGSTAEPAKPEKEVEEAAKQLWKWLCKDASTLRALMSFLSQGGVFYAAACAEKAARCYAKCSKETEATFVEAAKARLCCNKTAEQEIAPDDVACLFTTPEKKGLPIKS